MNYDDIKLVPLDTPSDAFQNSGYVPIGINDFEKICRTCLSSHEIQPIFDLKFNDTMVLDLLLSCASLEVSQKQNSVMHF